MVAGGFAAVAVGASPSLPLKWMAIVANGLQAGRESVALVALAATATLALLAALVALVALLSVVNKA